MWEILTVKTHVCHSHACGVIYTKTRVHTYMVPPTLLVARVCYMLYFVIEPITRVASLL